MSRNVIGDLLGSDLDVSVPNCIGVDDEPVQEIRTVAREHYEKPVRVRLLTQVDADAESFSPRVD